MYTVFHCIPYRFFLNSSFYIAVRYRSHVEHEWDNLGLQMQSLWDKFLDLIGDDKFNLYVYGII